MPENAGPLKFPAPTTVEGRRALQKLPAHTTSAGWLPDEGWLSELRPEHLRLRSQVAEQLDALDNLKEKFAKEDADQTDLLRTAHRDGTPVSGVKDRRTPPDKRAKERETIEAALDAGIIVLAEFADSVVESVRDNEDAWLADLRNRAGEAQDRRREAEKVLRESVAAEFHLHRLAQWILATSDDGPFGRTPAPEPALAPPNWTMPKGGLERPWHREKTGVAA